MTSRDDRLRSIQWKDLTTLTASQVRHELTLSLPWLAASLVCYQLFSVDSWWLAGGLFCSFYFYLTGLRQAHGAHHYTLGVSRRAQEWVMLALSLVMLSSIHAIQVTHLHHHAHCQEDSDVEAATARLPWYRALLQGPLFIVTLHVWALKLGNTRRRRWVVVEMLLILIWVVTVFGVLEWVPLKLHCLAMMVGQCGTGFFAVWTVHHDCEPEEVGRTQRGWKNRIAYDMFYHVEHHLFPAVPTCRLAELAERLDKAAPEMVGKRVY